MDDLFLGYMVEMEGGGICPSDTESDAIKIADAVAAGASWDEILALWGDEYDHGDLYKIYEYFGHTSEI